MRVPSGAAFSGVAALACASVLLEISLARIYAALFGEIHAFLALSLSLVGAGVAARLLYVARRSPARRLRPHGDSSPRLRRAHLAAVILLAHREPRPSSRRGRSRGFALCYAASTVLFALAPRARGRDPARGAGDASALPARSRRRRCARRLVAAGAPAQARPAPRSRRRSSSQWRHLLLPRRAAAGRGAALLGGLVATFVLGLLRAARRRRRRPVAPARRHPPAVA